MKLLYVNSLFPTAGDRRAIGGAETFAIRLVSGVLAAGHEVSIVRSGTKRGSGLETTPEGLQVHDMPNRNLYPMSDGRPHGPLNRLTWHLLEDRGRVSSAFRTVLETVRPDLVHTNNVVGMTTDVWRVIHEAGIPLLHTLHDYYLTCPRVQRYHDGQRCARTCASCSILTRDRRRAVRYIDKAIGVSQRMLDIHRGDGLLLDTPAEVILNMPPPLQYSAANMKQRSLGDTPVFGYIGRQAPEKGIYELLKAFAQLPANSACLVIAGVIMSDVRDWVSHNLPSPTDVVFTGFTTQIDFFPRIDVAVIPSIWEEPCSMGAGEAVSFGVPVIGSKRGGIPEMLEDGRLGWLFEPGTEELTSLIQHLVDNPSEITRKAEIIREQAQQDQRDRLVDAYLRVYVDMIDGRAQAEVAA